MSKLTWHFQQIPKDTLSIVNSTPVHWVKVVDPPQGNPFRSDIQVIGRIYHVESFDNHLIGLGAAGAEHYFNLCEYDYSTKRYVHCWEGPNEPAVSSVTQRANLVAFTKRWVELMHQAGYKAAVYSLSVGWPDTAQDARALAPGLENADYIALHEYSAPSMFDNKSYLCLRYRRFKEAIGDIPPVLVTECGIDGGVIGQGGRGWKSFGDFGHYLNSLRWYDSELKKDSYVECATIFTSGPFGDWRDFDVATAESRLLSQHIASDSSVEEYIGQDMQQHIIDLYPEAAFFRAGFARGMLPQSEERRIVIAGTTYAYQAYRHPDEPDVQYCVYCREGDWQNLVWFTRSN